VVIILSVNKQLSNKHIRLIPDPHKFLDALPRKHATILFVSTNLSDLCTSVHCLRIDYRIVSDQVLERMHYAVPPRGIFCSSISLGFLRY
jgi:hypothetical protein